MPPTATDPWADEDTGSAADAAVEATSDPATPAKAAEQAAKEPNGAPDGSPPGEKPAAKKTAAPATKKTAAASTARKTAAAAPAAAPAEAPKRRKRPSLSESTTYVTELVWGPEGTGKTTDALRMVNLHPEKRVLLIDAEAGAKIQALKQRGIDVDRIEPWPTEDDGGPGAITFEGMFDLAEELRLYSSEYIGWVWDSGSEITKRLLDQVTADARAKDARIGKDRGRFQVNLEDHGVASAMLRELLRKFRDLPMHGVITALERRDIDNDSGRVKYGPLMAPAMANDTAGLVDLVVFKEVVAIGEEIVRTGHTVPTRIRRAKDRFGVLPAKMADPFFDRIVGYVNGDITRENDPVQAHVRELAQAAANPGGQAGKAETNNGSET